MTHNIMLAVIVLDDEIMAGLFFILLILAKLPENEPLGM